MERDRRRRPTDAGSDHPGMALTTVGGEAVKVMIQGREDILTYGRNLSHSYARRTVGREASPESRREKWGST